MKIIYLANVRMPTEKAHGYQIVRTAAAMVEQGAQVELVVPKRRNPNLGSQDVFAYYGVKTKFPVSRLLSVDLIRCNLHRLIGPLAFWVQTWTFAHSVKKYLRTANADWVYGRDELLLNQITDLPKGAKLAVELHALPSVRYKKLLQRADRIVVITKAIRSGLVKQGVDVKKITVAPDAVDLGQFSNLPNRKEARIKFAPEGLAWSEDLKIALYTGHLYSWKGVFTFAQAGSYLPSGWFVVLVGGMPEDHKALGQYGHQLGFGDKVTVVRHVDRSELAYFLAAADVLVLPNSAKTDRSRLYTSPLKLFEYLAAGRPIVASDLPSIREVVSEKEVIFVKPDDPQDLARGIREAVEQPQEARVAAARELVKKYTWEGRAKTILEFLRL